MKCTQRGETDGEGEGDYLTHHKIFLTAAGGFGADSKIPILSVKFQWVLSKKNGL